MAAYIIGSVLGNGELSFSSNPTIHNSEASVRNEIERLAILNPNKTFVYFRALGKATKASVYWTEVT